MYLDAHLKFSDAQAITAEAYSTNVYDIADVDRDLGTGTSLYLVVVVDVAFTDSGSNSTLTCALAYDSSATMAGSPTVFQTIGSLGALSAIGTKLIAKLQPFTIPERYIAMKYTPVNGDLSAGSVTAFLTRNVSKYINYNDNVTIS